MKLIVTANRPSSPDDLARYQKVAAILGPHVVWADADAFTHCDMIPLDEEETEEISLLISDNGRLRVDAIDSLSGDGFVISTSAWGNSPRSGSSVLVRFEADLSDYPHSEEEQGLSWHEKNPDCGACEGVGTIHNCGAMDKTTLTVSREGGPDITCVLYLDKQGRWDVWEALDEWGRPVALTLEEINGLIARAEAGEDETGR